MRVRSGSAAQWFGGIGVVLVAFLGAPTARASEGKTTKGGSSSPSSAATPGGTPAEGGRPPGAEGGRSDQADESEDDAEPIRIGLDFVAGTGKTSIANTAQPTQLEGMPANTIGSSQVTTESFIAAAGLEVHHFEFGLRMPLTIGQINPPDIPSRRTTAFGNLELEGAYLHELRPGLSLVYALGVTLPTAQGQAVPSSASGLSSNSSGVLDLNSYDRGAINLAAASTRGWEENALFELQRVGIIPKVELRYETHGLLLQPYVKLDNLIDTSGHADHSYLGELVVGGRIAYRVVPHFEPGVRVWTNLNGELTGISSDKPVGVVEPEVRLPFHHVEGIVGGILPFAGPLTNPYFLGIRAAVRVAF